MVSDLGLALSVPRVHSPVALIFYCGIFEYLSRGYPLKKHLTSPCVFTLSRTCSIMENIKKKTSRLIIVLRVVPCFSCAKFIRKDILSV